MLRSSLLFKETIKAKETFENQYSKEEGNEVWKKNDKIKLKVIRLSILYVRPCPLHIDLSLFPKNNKKTTQNKKRKGNCKYLLK